MNEFDRLAQAVMHFTGMSSDEFNLSQPYWRFKDYQKGELYNAHRAVCKNLGFIFDGVFRSFIIDGKTGEEKNVFFYSTNQFVVTFKSFVNQIPCDYHTESMINSSIVYINIADLHELYKSSHAWERFGRLLAQEAFNVVMQKTEGHLFKTAEERYLDLVKYHPEIFNTVPLYHISSYLGIQGPSLSRIRKRLLAR